MKTVVLMVAIAASVLSVASWFETRTLARRVVDLEARSGTRPAAGVEKGPARDVSTPSSIELTLEHADVKGSPNAPVVLVEFSDFECPFCGRHWRDAFSRIDREYIQSGKVRYAFRHFPLEAIHPNAFRAGEAAECARRQGRFWPMHDRMFANARLLQEPDLIEHARAIGADVAAFENCLPAAAADRVRSDQAEGQRASIAGTPMFFLGTATSAGRVKTVRAINGAHPYEVFKIVIDRMLARSAAGPASSTRESALPSP